MGLCHLYKVIFKITFSCFICIGMFMSWYCKTTNIWWCHLALYVVGCILTLSSTYLFLQYVQVGYVLQGVPPLPTGAFRVCASGVHLSRYRQGLLLCWCIIGWLGVWEDFYNVFELQWVGVGHRMCLQES